MNAMMQWLAELAGRWRLRQAVAVMLTAAVVVGAVAVSRADDALDHSFTQRLAFDLGDKVALSILVRSALLDRRPDPGDMRSVRYFGRVVETRAQRLGVADVIARQWIETTSLPRVRMYSEGYQRMVAAGTALGAKFGERANTVFELGFRLRLEPDTVVHTSADKRAAIFAQQRRLAQAAGFDPSILSAYQSALDTRLPPAQRLLQSEKVYFAIREQLEKSMFNHPEIRRLRANVFEAANAVALSVLGAAYGADRATVDQFFQRGRIYGRNAKIAVSGIAVDGLAFPELPAMSGKRPNDLANGIHYLLQVVGKDQGSQLEQLYGKNVAALLDLAIKLNLSMVLYLPGDRIGTALRESIERSGDGSWMPASLWQPVVTAMRDGKDQSAVKKRVIDVIGTIRKYLEEQRSKS